MSDSLRDFLVELSGDGDLQGSESGFTLSSDKAREKLKKFALAHPENYFLLIVAGLQALGARRFELTVDADDLRVEGDCTIERGRLARLWESVAGGAGGQSDSGLRLLGLAILTSVRFDKVTWAIESVDAEGRFRLVQAVVKERLPDPVLESVSTDGHNTVVSVKRRDVRRVASRFFNQLTNRLFAKEWEEERLLSERVFLGALEKFSFNGRNLDCRLQASRGLALLKVGKPPDFLSAKHVFQETGEQDVVVMIGSEPNLPGQSKKVTWLWHGLEMGHSRLGLSYDFCRVFVVADNLRCDLSLTALADTWARQKALRLAREATRKALELMAELYLSFQTTATDREETEMESYLLEVLANRIDIKRNRHRLGSFNDTLVRCPLFQLSEADGTRRRGTLFEIWERIEQGKNPAIFKSKDDWCNVPAWEDRPAVILAEARHYAALTKIFGERAFLDGVVVAGSVEKLTESRREFVPPTPSEWQGARDTEGQTLNWHLDLKKASKPGRLVVLKEQKIYFEDSSLNLPKGFLFYGEVDWEPNFGGALADMDLRDRLPDLALQEIVKHLNSKTSPPTELDIEVIGCVCRGLRGQQKLWTRPFFDENEWLVARESNDQLFWLSPRQFWNRTKDKEVTPYYESFTQAKKSRSDLPLCLVIPPEVVEFLPQPFQHVRGVEIHRDTPSFSFPDDGYEVVEIDPGDISLTSIEAVQVGFPTRKQVPNRAVLELNLRGHGLQSETVTSFVAPVTVCLNIEKGWPDSEGRQLVDKERLETLKQAVPEILTEASRRLMLRLTPHSFAKLHPELQGTLTVDLWSEGEQDFVERVPTSSEARISFAHLRSLKTVRYFSDPERAGEVPVGTVFLSSPQVEALQMVSEVDLWVEETSASGQEEIRAESVSMRAPPSAPAPAKKVVAAKPVTQKLLSPKSERPEPDNAKPSGASKPPKPEEKVQNKLENVPTATNDSWPEEFEQTKTQAPALSNSLSCAGPWAGALQELLQSVHQADEVPFFKEFTLYLSSIVQEDTLDLVLEERGGQPVLRSMTEPSEDLLCCLLSALYSSFNRSLALVEDSHEQKFHKALVVYATRR